MKTYLFPHRPSGGSIARRYVSMATAALTGVAHAAGLPTLQPPSQGNGSGIIQTLQNYGYDIVMLVSLLVIANMFIGVCYHAYNTYSEIHTGRKTWGEFGLTVAGWAPCCSSSGSGS